MHLLSDIPWPAIYVLMLHSDPHGMLTGAVPFMHGQLWCAADLSEIELLHEKQEKLYKNN